MYTFSVTMYYSAIEIDLYSLYRKNLIATFELRDQNYEKTIISLLREPSRIEKSRHFVYVRALIMRKILRSKDAQCNTRESP